MTPVLIDSCDAFEVLQRYCVSLRGTAAEQLELISIAAYPHMKVDSQKAQYARVRAMLTVGVTIPSVYRTCTDEERVRLIGCALNSPGADQWMHRYSSELSWLLESGHSIEDAKNSDRLWTKQAIDTGFFNDSVASKSVGLSARDLETVVTNGSDSNG